MHASLPLPSRSASASSGSPDASQNVWPVQAEMASHPAAIGLARLLAREAAAAWLAQPDRRRIRSSGLRSGSCMTSRTSARPSPSSRPASSC